MVHLENHFRFVTVLHTVKHTVMDTVDAVDVRTVVRGRMPLLPKSLMYVVNNK